jgi:hypothetical protein
MIPAIITIAAGQTQAPEIENKSQTTFPPVVSSLVLFFSPSSIAATAPLPPKAGLFRERSRLSVRKLGRNLGRADHYKKK